MVRNKSIIDRAKSYIRNANKENAEAVESLVEKYEVACGLSTGPVPARSQVWEAKAAEARNVLCRAIGYGD